MDRRSNLSGSLLVLAAGVLWGTVGPAQVLAGPDAGPVAVGGARIFSGGAVLAALVLATDRRAFLSLGRRTWRPVAAASAATGVFQAAFFSAVDRTGAAVATAVVFGLAPVSTGLCERLVLGTRLGRRWWAGTACAVGGVALLMVPGEAVHADPVGIGLSLVGGTCFGVYTVSAKVLTGREAGMAAAVSVTLLIGGAALLPWTLAELPALAEPRSAVLVGWLGIAATAAAYMFFVTGLGGVAAATAGTLSLAEPLVAAALAIAVLGERMSAPVAAGSLLLLGGLFVVSVPARARTARYDGAHVTGAVKVETTTGERN
ncbi:EamA family transporter [Actinomadura bangladeshensis]|uniref:EamA family transporter n=1 Tax=Actinomadura bangladeshensis TaxID=453573 RepID=A0A4V2XNP7_9ACTN|nr:EamA family transporter [Actinomadura bangladeshensis]TDC19016.1 EamA family transporter [Actinomadura bangladeshensis]